MKLVQQGAAWVGMVLVAGVAVPAAAQRSDSFTWKLGIDAGIMTFETQTQPTKVVPTAGAHILVMGHRGGLMFGVDEGIGTNQNTIPAKLILFNDVRRYQAVLMAFPISGNDRTVLRRRRRHHAGRRPAGRPAAGITDPTEHAALLSNAQQESASAFATFVGGVQGRVGTHDAVRRSTRPPRRPATTTCSGARPRRCSPGSALNLGSAREGVKAGGY